MSHTQMDTKQKFAETIKQTYQIKDFSNERNHYKNGGSSDNVWIGDNTQDFWVGDNPLFNKYSSGDNFGYGYGEGKITFIPSGDSTEIKFNPDMITTKDTTGIFVDNTIQIPDANKNPFHQPEPKQKLDKDLINTKLPYNIKISENKTLIYEIAVAGYNPENVEVGIVKKGLHVIIRDSTDDDLIGDEDDKFVFIAKGLKVNTEEFDIFIDDDLYDLDSLFALVENGLLTLKINSRKELRKKVTVKTNRKRTPIV